jgi:hypothetical protein
MRNEPWLRPGPVSTPGNPEWIKKNTTDAEQAPTITRVAAVRPPVRYRGVLAFEQVLFMRTTPSKNLEESGQRRYSL